MIMRTIGHSLAWKEWHEHKWKLAAIMVILVSVALLAMQLQHPRDALPLAAGMLLLCGIPLAVFVGLGSAAGERSHETLRFLQALPVPLWRVALHKLAFGLVTLIVPLVITLLVIAMVLLIRPLRTGDGGADKSLAYIATYLSAPALMGVLLAASLYIWSAAVGVNRKDEVSAGSVALAVMVGYWLVLVTLWSALLLRSTSVETAPLRLVAAATAPGGLLTFFDIADQQPLRSVLLGGFAGLVAHGLLAARYVRRFGQIAENEIRSPQTAQRDVRMADWLAPPRRSAVSAIAWKQFRESGPIVLVGLAAIVAIFVVLVVSVWAEGPPGSLTPAGIVYLYRSISTVFGVVIALVVGIGVCLYDVSPRLNTFWRSRPINADVWFWTKFSTGLAVLLTAIYVPLRLVGWFAGTNLLWDPDANYIPAMHMAIYAAAVFTTCTVRHAVYAAILSIAVVYISMVSAWAAWLLAGVLGWTELGEHWWEPSEIQIAAGLTLSFVLSTVFAWLAVRYDWGRKSRY